MVGGMVVKESPAEGGAWVAPSVPWIAVVLGLETTISVCLVLVVMRVLGLLLTSLGLG